MKVLVIGAGPSYWKKLSLARSFEGIIIATDIVAQHLVDEGIIPHYIISLEKNEGIETAWFPDNFADYSFEAIFMDDALPILKQRFAKLGIKHNKFRSYKQERISNVGLYACRFAREKLKATELYLIGFDHDGMNIRGTESSSHIHQRWIADFEVFLADEGTQCKVYNCSGQGKLFLPGIIDGRDLKVI